MADLETRVAALERELSDLKAKVEDYDADLQNIPDLIRTESRFTKVQIDRLTRDVAGLDRRFDTLEAKVDALPRALAEIVKEMLEKKS